ncbi:MAG: sensor histidine kinase [Rhodoblastus sp.]|uniref:sensor histidine kinase n=1 Tax=Rhodoblastus sp. TaxID=1962975 RepID=UPI003F960FD1
MPELEGLKSELKAKMLEQERTAALLAECEARVTAANLALGRRVDEHTAELKATNARLKEALEQRDILLREVYHRVKNNLQIVDGLLALQSRQITDKDAVAALRNVRQRVYAMGLVHQQLMKSADLKTFDVAPFLRDLVKNVIDSGAYRGVNVSVQSIPLKVGLDFAIPLGLLVTELLTNSLKHAFPEGVGSVSIALGRGEHDKISLIVSDNGQTSESAQSPFAPKPGYGINIITGLVSQLKGALVMENINGARTEILLATPVQS